MGANTIRQDNPKLTARNSTGTNPSVIIVNRKNDLDKNQDVFKSKADKIIITEKLIDFNKPVAIQISNILYKKKINSVIIEGGLKTLTTFIKENIWDEARIFKSPVKFKKGVKAPLIKIKPKYETKIIYDKLLVIYNEQL